MSEADAAPQSPRENPYVGLLPFDEEDVAWFFGRDREQRIIGANLRSSRLTLLYGASGVGKSSVLLAGVVPGLRAVVAEDRAARQLDDGDEREPVRFAVSVFGSWRDAPLHGLMTAVAMSVQEATGEPVEPWSPGTSLRETFAGWLGPVATLLIVLDQFEEYFLYHPHDDGAGTFAGEFVDVVNDTTLRVHFLVSLREDGLAKLDRFKGRIPRLFDNYLRVRHLDLDAARRAIEGPKDEYNRRLVAGSNPATIDEELIDAVLTEVRTRDVALEGPGGAAPESPDATAAAADRVETPLLQLVMERLWEAGAVDGAAPHLRLATLREQLGGTEKIVYRHLEQALDALSDSDRDVAVDVLRPLVSPSGTKIAWRAVDLAYWAKRETEAIEPVLQELSRGDRRILREVTPPAAQADQSARYEIFHDVLAEPILEWCGEREAERERAQLAHELEQKERERQEVARERRRERRSRIVRRVALGLAALTIGLIVAVYVAIQNNKIATSRGLAASAMTQLPVDPERSLLLAIKAMERRDTNEAKQALRRSLATSRVRAALGKGERRPRPCADCGALATAPRGNGTAFGGLAVAPDGRAVAGIVGRRLRLWQPRTGETFKSPVEVGEASGVVFTPDASRLVVVGTKRSALMAPDGTRVHELAGEYSYAATSPDSRYVATVGDSGAAVWDARNGELLGQQLDSWYRGVAFRDAGQLVLQDSEGKLVLWRWRAGKTRLVAPASGARVLSRYSAGGEFAVTLAADGGVQVVAANGRVTRLPPGTRTDQVTGANISPDGSRIATVRGATVELWRSKRPWSAPAQRVGQLGHAAAVSEVVFSADSKLVGTASLDGTARVWESLTGELVAELRGHSAGVEWLGFSSRGRYVATVAEDLTMRLWDLGRGRTLRGLRGGAAVAVGESGSRVAILQNNGALKIWDTRSASAQTLADGGAARLGDVVPSSVAFGADDRSVLVGYATPDGTKGSAALREIATGRVRVSIDRSGPVAQMALDPKGRVAAFVRLVDDARGSRVELWGLTRGHAAKRLGPPVRIDGRERPTDAAFSPDGRRLLVTTVWGAARIYDVGSRKEVAALATDSVANPGSEAFYRGVFSPDGKTVAVAGARDVRLWDSRSKEERDFRLSGHTSLVNSVAYSDDGRRIVTASADGTTRVWDARTGTTLAVLSRHAGPVNGAAFLPDPDGAIISAGDDRTVRVYPCDTCVPTDRLLEDARKQVTRDLTARELKDFVE